MLAAENIQNLWWSSGEEVICKFDLIFWICGLECILAVTGTRTIILHGFLGTALAHYLAAEQFVSLAVWGLVADGKNAVI